MLAIAVKCFRVRGRTARAKSRESKIGRRWTPGDPIAIVAAGRKAEPAGYYACDDFDNALVSSNTRRRTLGSVIL